MAGWGDVFALSQCRHDQVENDDKKCNVTCEYFYTIFSDLTETIFAEHQLSIPEIFRIICKTEDHTANGYC